MHVEGVWVVLKWIKILISLFLFTLKCRYGEPLKPKMYSTEHFIQSPLCKKFVLLILYTFLIQDTIFCVLKKHIMGPLIGT